MSIYEKGNFIKLKKGEIWVIEDVKENFVYAVNVKTDEKDMLTITALDWLVLNGEIEIYCADYELDE